MSICGDHTSMESGSGIAWGMIVEIYRHFLAEGSSVTVGTKETGGGMDGACGTVWDLRISLGYSCIYCDISVKNP